MLKLHHNPTLDRVGSSKSIASFAALVGQLQSRCLAVAACIASSDIVLQLMQLC